MSNNGAIRCLTFNLLQKENIYAPLSLFTIIHDQLLTIEVEIKDYYYNNISSSCLVEYL